MKSAEMQSHVGTMRAITIVLITAAMAVGLSGCATYADVEVKETPTSQDTANARQKHVNDNVRADEYSLYNSQGYRSDLSLYCVDGKAYINGSGTARSDTLDEECAALASINDGKGMKPNNTDKQEYKETDK